MKLKITRHDPQDQWNHWLLNLQKQVDIIAATTVAEQRLERDVLINELPLFQKARQEVIYDEDE